MNFKTLDDFDFKGKRVLLRSDLNSELKDGKAIMSPRISESAKTIKELLKKGARVIILAHQGRKGEEDFTDLSEHAKLLNKLVKVKYINDIIGARALLAIEELKEGEALLLENVRFLDEEMKPSLENKMVKILSKRVDIYINDAFSVSHRPQTSIVSFPQVLENGVGRLMQHELESLEKLKVEDALYILGGSKEENIKIMQAPNRKILTCGIFGQLCTIAKGYNLGAQNKFLEKQINEIVPKIKPFVASVFSPADFAVKDSKGKRLELKLEQFPSEFEIFDIGQKTIERYIEEIMKAKVILMKGTAGYCEEKQFSIGTEAILKAMIKSKAFTVIGGGHASSAIEKLKIPKNKFGYISLSGGAFVSYLSGEKLPGLEALKKKEDNPIKLNEEENPKTTEEKEISKNEEKIKQAENKKLLEPQDTKKIEQDISTNNNAAKEEKNLTIENTTSS